MSNVMLSPGKDESDTHVPGLPAMGRALAHRNFRLFVVGQGISVIGTWMQQIATVWLVYRLSQSSMLLGIADFTAQIPAALILPLAGVLTDRWNRHRTVLATQTLMMIQAFALLALTVTGVISVWQILVLGALLGVVSAFDATARQAFVIDMVEPSRPGQRDRHQFVGLQRCPSAWPGGCRHRDRTVRRVALLSA